MARLYNLSFPNNFPATMNGDLPEFGLVGKISGTRYSGDDVADTGVRDVRGCDFQKLRVDVAGTCVFQRHLFCLAHQLHIARPVIPHNHIFRPDITKKEVACAFVLEDEFFYEATSQEEALAFYEQDVLEGRIDFSDAEMVDSSEWCTTIWKK